MGSGLVSALLKGVQLLAAAHRQGHLRLAAVSAHESAATAHTHGAAFLTALRWLAELRCACWGAWGVHGCRRVRASQHQQGALTSCRRPCSCLITVARVAPLCREAPPAGAMPLAFAAGAGLAPHVGLQPVSLSLTRGKHCRGDQSYAPIQASLQACFDAFSAPVAAKLTPQGGLLLHADAFALTAWLATPSAAALLSPLAAAAAGGGASAAGAQLSGALLADDVAADMQCAKAFAAVLEFEAARGADGGADACAQDASAHQAALRQALVGSIVAVATRLGVQVREVGRLGGCMHSWGMWPAWWRTLPGCMRAAALHSRCAQTRTPRTPALHAPTAGGDGAGCGAAVRPYYGCWGGHGGWPGSPLCRRHAAALLPSV